MLLSAFRGGASGLYRFDIETRTLELAQDFGAVHGGLSLDRTTGAVYQAASSLNSTGQIVRNTHEPKASTVIVDPNAELLAETPMADWETFSIERGGYEIEAWILKPSGFDPTKRYPMVLDIHGGPE